MHNFIIGIHKLKITQQKIREAQRIMLYMILHDWFKIGYIYEKC